MTQQQHSKLFRLANGKVPKTFLVLVAIVFVLLVVLNGRVLRLGLSSRPLLLSSSGFIPYTDDDILYPRVFHLMDRAHIDEYFTIVRTDRGTVVKCLKAGTNTTGATKGCSCKARWQGPDCAIPDAVWYSKDQVPTRVKSTRLRRLVVVSWFSADDQSSLDLMEAQIKETGDVVDVFFIVETNFTRSCQPNEPVLLNHLRKGFLKEYHNKIVYNLMHACPPSGVRSWPEFHQLVSGVGVFHLVNDYRPDDIILFSAPNEIMSSDYLIYLKVHTGLPEPYVVSVRQSALGLRFILDDEVKIAGSSIKYLVSVCKNHGVDLQFNGCDDAKNSPAVARYRKFDTKNVVKRWKTSAEHPVWWRCYWCLPPSPALAKHVNEVYERTGVRLTVQRTFSALTNSTEWKKSAFIEDKQKVSKLRWASVTELPRIFLMQNYTDSFENLLTGNLTGFDYQNITSNKSR